MPRLKKDAKVLNVKLEKGIYERFEAYCDELGQTKTTALERILDQRLKSFESQREKENRSDLEK